MVFLLDSDGFAWVEDAPTNEVASRVVEAACTTVPARPQPGMRPPSVYANPADPGAHAELLGLLHSPHRVACRLVMILLSHQGWSPAAIASLLGYDPLTVRRWLHRYNLEGVVGLTDRPRPGRPRLGGPALGERILRVLDQPRAWTIARLWQRLGRPAMSLRTLHRRTREVAAWRRPRLVAKGDPDAEQAITAVRQAISGLPQGSVVLAEDETHLNLLPFLRATWIARGTRQQVMTPGKNQRRSVFGAVDLLTGWWFYQVARKAVSATFIAFLEQLAAAYPGAPVVAVICDNVIIHHSRLVRAWLATHPQVRVLHGARYSPHDNPVERIWGALKGWLANTPTLTMAGRIRQVHAFFRARTPPRCWQPPRRTAHRGCPKVTHKTSGRPLSHAMVPGLG
jgi:transposase